jgi:uroporphyrinogen-III decarboxylase
MNSTQRLLAVLTGELPDRVPISTYELAGWNSRGWENLEPSYRRLMDFIRQHTDCMYMTDVPVPNALAASWDVQTQRWDEGDQHVTRTVIHAGGRSLSSLSSYSDNIKTVWQREHLVKDLDDLRTCLDLPWEAGEPDFAGLHRAWAELEDTRGLPLVTFADPLCELAEAFEFGNFMVHMMTEPAAMLAAMDCLHERRLEALRRILRGPVCGVIFRIAGPEYATPPYLPPDLFRLLVTRYDSRYVRMIQEARAFARIHCHGKIARVLDQIDQMSPDALDPLEPPPDGDIDLPELKRRIGGRICLMGGIELKHLETRGRPFVADLVRRTIQAGKPGGRFVIMPTAAPINIPLSRDAEANYFRFIETALEAGTY